MTETKSTVPSSVDVPKGTGSAWGNGSKKHRGNSGKTSSNSNSNSETTTVDKQFRNDSQDLGVMYQRYFDCSSPHDQVRFTLTQERLSIYAGEKYQPFGKDFKAAIIDPTNKPTVPAVVMPTKTITHTDGSTSVVNKTEGDLEYLDKLMLKEQVGLQVKKEMQLTGLKQTLFNFIYGRCTELLQDRIKSHKSYDALTRSSDPFDLLTNGKQCTIVWHVDDLKISHVEREVVEQVIKDLNAEFGKHKPLTGKIGLVHEYLGMTLDYSTKGKLKVRMDDYTEKLLSECPEFFDGEAPTPAANNLFTVRDDSGSYKIPEDQADEFHRITAKLLFLSLRARPDILTAVSFLCTRVSKPDIDDRHKLRRVIRYLRKNPKLHLTLECDNVASMHWFVDASYGVHPDMRSHTGAVMTMGKGAVISGSNKQKLNTKSSTEAELVGVDDYMAKILSVRYFTEEQGYPVGTTTVHQDNQSTILLEKNGQASSSKRTRHINIRYFFVTDRVNKKEIKIEYCPTKEMMADFFTKPLQGCLFYKLRALIMNMDA